MYVLGVLVVVLTMIMRRNVVIPCILFTFLIGWAYKGSLVKAVQVLFNANLVAAKELFGIFLIISLMVAMLKSLSETGGDELLVKPLNNLMVSPLISYLVVCAATLVISLFFWPTPAVPLVGALLIPAAIRAGLPPMLAAMALALAGQGMALAGDVVIQGAPGLTAKSAGIATELVTWRGGLLTLITGTVAIALGYFLNRKEIKDFQQKKSEVASTADVSVAAREATAKQADLGKGKFLAGILVLAMTGAIISMFALNIKGGDASALIGGAAIMVMAIATIVTHGVNSLDKIADHIADGLVFAFKVMGPIIPIAGFFFLGNPELVADILGKGAPGFLFDVGKMIADVIPPTGFVAAFGLLIVGAITGLDGSGFSGLPLVGTLSGAMAAGNPDVAAVLGAIGQMGAIWSGGGTLVAWSSLVAVAGIVGVPVMDLVRKNAIPVIAGLIASTVFAVLFLM
ncbi:hypothetical protein [Desulfovirgula thermocuniculi]|uniref:hypothetical protein n=1 Tax=Desulfovirgula thermocuniculi TaxID=348842 RepID=UPI001B7FD479|nr:hypothetical protein [Desulfovirgula thermocuniculi]